MGNMQKSTGRASCEVCGESRERCFEVHLGGQKHVFDSFECAIRGLLPKCALCEGLILWSGIKEGSETYCSHLCRSLYLYNVHKYARHEPS
jgi:hypothetical protein